CSRPWRGLRSSWPPPPIIRRISKTWRRAPRRRTPNRPPPSAPPGFSSRRTPRWSARPRASPSAFRGAATTTTSGCHRRSATEAAIIFGKQGSDIPREKALDYVIGYSIGLDMTARGPEDRSFRKSIDTYSVLGPWLVTADEIRDPDNVPLSISINGEVKQSSSTKQMIYDCRKLIEWGSTFYTFYPGDVLYTGTPEGVSPVKPGDTMIARIEPIGEMSVPVRAHKPGGELACGR